MQLTSINKTEKAFRFQTKCVKMVTASCVVIIRKISKNAVRLRSFEILASYGGHGLRLGTLMAINVLPVSL